MKIFHCVESYFPSVGGMQEVVKQLSERLVKLGHDVTVLTRVHPERSFTTLNGVKIKAFNVVGNPITPESAADKEYIDFILNEPCNVITFFAAQQWATNLALPILKQIKAKKVSVPTGYSGLYWPQFKQYFEDMKTYIHNYDMNVYLSNDYRDINYARENGVKNMTIIPNGAGADEFLPESKINIRKKLGIPEKDPVILLVGSFTSWKGHKEALEIFLEANIKNTTLLMVGNNYEYFKRIYYKNPGLLIRKVLARLFKGKRVFFDFYSREFTVAAYKQSDLFLFPSNIECSPIVLFECAAAKLPFLSTQVGNSVEISEWTKGGEIMPTQIDEQGFSHADISKGAKMLEELMNNEAKRKKMGRESFEIWSMKYSWEVITKQYESLYKSLLGQ